MIWRADRIFGWTVQCSDGEVGTVSDLYFDEEQWAVRYVVIHIEEPIEATTALVSVTAVDSLDWDGRILRLALESEKIRNSPEVDTDLPVTREYETALHRYYEWPVYWGQVSFLDTPRTKGMGDPAVPHRQGRRFGAPAEAPDAYNYDEGDYEEAQNLASGEPDDEEVRELEFAEPAEERTYSSSLHSVSRMRENSPITVDEERLAVMGLLVDDEDWTIRHLVVATDAEFKEQQVLVPVGHVKGFRAATAELDLDLSGDDIRGSPSYHGNMEIADYERNLYAYYDREGLG